ncbi:MAG: hypothetical protein K6G36_01340 [Candidatus Saccharibacteria bacterium]|nr:hypothetical protein [Candidatus Saccharibacteria bacterium]
MKVQVERPHNGETIYYFKLGSFDSKKEGEIESELINYRRLGLCSGHDLSRLPWGEIRVYHNPVFQKERVKYMESVLIKNIQELFS